MQSPWGHTCPWYVKETILTRVKWAKEREVRDKVRKVVEPAYVNLAIFIGTVVFIDTLDEKP